MQKRAYWQEETKKFAWKHVRMALIAEEINSRSALRSVLDLGAGEALLYHLIRRDIRYRGLDIAGEKDATTRVPPVDYFDFDHLPEQYAVVGTPYDCAVISGLLEYLTDWKGLLEHTRSTWLKPEGVCLVSFINASGYSLLSPVRGHPKWITRFRLPEVLPQLESLGYVVERVYPIFWGSKQWLRPIITTWAERACRLGDFNILDKPWVSQYLCVTRLK